MSNMFNNQLEKLKYTLSDDNNNNSNGTAWELLIKYFECRDNDIIEKLLKMNEEKERKMRDETIFNVNVDRIPKLDFEKDNYEEWFYAIKSCIRKTTFYTYFEKKDTFIEKNYENELYDIMEESIVEETKKQLQLEETNKNPRKLLKEILRAKQSLKSKKITVLMNYINNHKYHRTDDISRHLEILLMLFDELSKLHKVFSEQEKLEKILNTLPEDYRHNIKKLINGSQQLGLGILYIVKYVEIWNKKYISKETEFNALANDQPFLYSEKYLKSITSSYEKIEENENSYSRLSEAKSIKNPITETEKLDSQKIKVSVLSIKNSEIENDHKNENLPNTKNMVTSKDKTIGEKEKKLNMVKTENEIEDIHEANEENESISSNKDTEDDNKTLNQDSSSNEGEDNSPQIKEREVQDSEVNLEKEETLVVEKKKSIFGMLFSTRNLLFQLIFMIVFECLIYFKYDSLKNMIHL